MTVQGRPQGKRWGLASADGSCQQGDIGANDQEALVGSHWRALNLYQRKAPCNEEQCWDLGKRSLHLSEGQCGVL